MKTQQTNHLAVWLCVVLNQLLSVLWYSPFLFAFNWMNYLGKSFEDFKGESMSGLIFSIAGGIASNYFLSWLFRRLEVHSGLKGLLTGAALGFCCFTFQTFTQDSFSLRPFGLSFINSGSVLLNFCVSGLIIGGWAKKTANKS